MPDDVVLPPGQALAQAQLLLDADLPFHAHEVLEAVWKAAPEGERDLWQGLAQLAVGLTHVRRGNPVGAATLLRRARARLTPYADAPPHGIDLTGLQDWIARALAETVTESDRAGPAGAPSPQLPPPRLRRPASDARDESMRGPAHGT